MKLAIMPIFASEALLHENKKKIKLKILPLVRIESEAPHGPALLIPTKSSKSKNQVVHIQKFKDTLSNTCLISSEKRVLDLESEVN